MSAHEESHQPDFSRANLVPYTLRMGVTGHRELDDETVVRAAVERLIRRIDDTLRREAEEPRNKAFSRLKPRIPRQVAPDPQVPLKWCVVTALAKGADQIVADVVLKDVHGDMRAILPFTPKVYERDFETPKERETFRHFLKDAEAPWVAFDADNPSAKQRTTAYRLVGERVVDESDIMIAVWDGEPGRGEGGTAEIVSYAVRQDVPIYWIHANAPSREPVLLTAAEKGTH